MPLLFLSSAVYAYAMDDLPPGFENFLETDEMTMIRVQFGNLDLGESMANFNDEEITLEEPQRIFDRLKPYIRKTSQAIILNELHRTLATHMDRACTNGPTCGLLQPKILGVIFDRNQYQARLFINPDYLIKQSSIPAKYLEEATSGFGMLNQFQFGASGNNDHNHALSINHNGFIGSGNWHLDYETNYTYSVAPDYDTIQQFQFRDLDLNWRHKQYYLSAGLQDTVGTLIIPTFQMVGASFQTNTELITNLNQQIATPVEVNIITPSYVDIYRNNTLIDTQYFPPGNYFLDTRSFPSGAYFLRLEIRTLNNQITTRQVYFIKTTALPLLSLPNYYISYGRLATLDSTTLFPTLTNLNVLSLEAKWRLHKMFGIGEHIALFNENEVINELSFMAELNHLSMMLSGAFSNFGDTGLGFSVAGSVHGITLNSYFRQIWLKSTSADVINTYLEGTDTSNTNIGSSLAFSWRDINFDAGLSYAYIDGAFQHNLEFGASKYFSIGAYHDFTLAISLDSSESNTSLFLQMTWNIGSDSGGYGAVGTETQIAKAKDSAMTREQNIKLNVGHTFNSENTNNDVGTSAQIGKDGQYYSQYATTDNPYFDALQQFDFAHSQSTGDTLSYNFKLATALAYAPLNNWGISHSDQPSGALVRVNSDIQSRYTLYIDGEPVREINNNTAYFIPLTSYREHNLQIQSHALTISVPNNDIGVVVYPGNVERVIRKAASSMILMGVFTGPDGVVLSHATIQGGIEAATTDAEGFAQVDVVQGSQLSVISKNKKVCHIKTTGLKPDEGIIFLDQIMCK